MANSTTNQKTQQQSGSNTSSSTVGGSHSETNTHTQGYSNTETFGKTWASGKVEEKTQQNFDKYNEDYQEGQKVQDAYEALQQTLSGKPSFESKYQAGLESIYNQIMNREKFSYDFNKDAMYQLYKDQYTASGKQAMQDTMGQAQAMNGGYGSSYSQSAGQQTYQNYLQDLNNAIPVLRDQALQEYQMEGQDLANRFNLSNAMYQNEYGQYRDDVSDWQSDRSFNYGMYADERQFDYGQFQDNRNYWMQEYWNEKNQEHSSYSNSTTNYEEDSHSVTDSSYWENSDSSTTGWQNSASTSSTMSAAARGAGNDPTTPTGDRVTVNDRRSPVREFSSEWYALQNTPNANYIDQDRKAYDTGTELYLDLSKDSPLLNNRELLSYEQKFNKKFKGTEPTINDLKAFANENGLDEEDVVYLYHMIRGGK